MASFPRNEPGKDNMDTGPSLAPCWGGNQRRSERVFLTLLIRVSGRGEHGKDFLEEGRTEDVSRHGASIVVDRELITGQDVKIQRLGVGKEAMARVVGRIVGRSESRAFGVALLDPAVNLWDITFPAVPRLEKAVLRALLKCIACGRLEVCHLSEFEADIFLRHHCICRICELCGGWTTWTRPIGLAFPDLSVPMEVDSQQRSQHAVVRGTQNLRSHHRIQVDAVGRVRHPTLGNEVVLVRDLARGGLSFYSANYYPEGTRVEMAVPYASKAPNIYSSAKIVSSRRGAEKGLIEYGVSYLL